VVAQGKARVPEPCVPTGAGADGGGVSEQAVLLFLAGQTGKDEGRGMR
jgi:hypothetical protein